MRSLDDTWARFRALAVGWQALLWLFLFRALIPLLIWRSSLSRGWKMGLSVVFAILLIGIAASSEESTTPVATEAPSAEEAETSDEGVDMETGAVEPVDDDVSRRAQPKGDKNKQSRAEPDNVGPPPCDRNDFSCLEDVAYWLAEEKGHNGAQADTFANSYLTCSSVSPKQVAREFNAASNHPVDAAYAYAHEMYVPGVAVIAETACLSAFLDRR